MFSSCEGIRYFWSEFHQLSNNYILEENLKAHLHEEGCKYIHIPADRNLMITKEAPKKEM